MLKFYAGQLVTIPERAVGVWTIVRPHNTGLLHYDEAYWVKNELTKVEGWTETKYIIPLYSSIEDGSITYA